MVDTITGDDWQDWAFHPMTRELIKHLERMVIEEKVNNRNFTDQATVIKQFFTSEGRCLGIEEVMHFINEKKGNMDA